MPIPSNPFVALLPSRIGGQPKSFGREDHITAALGVLLHADAVAGGDLCRDVFRRLFGIALEGQIQISVQSEHDEAGRSCIIDLHVETPTQIVFIENKTGARLGVREDPQTKRTDGQLELYQKELKSQARFDPSRRYLGMLTWAPPVEPAKRDYWTGAVYWWDLLKALDARPASADGYVERLRLQFLELLTEVELTPPQALTKENVYDPSAVQPVLALALQRATERGAQFEDVRPASWGAYLVSTREKGSGAPGPKLHWSVGLLAGFPEVHCAKRGYIRVTLPADFLTQSLECQIAWLAEYMWERVARGEGIVRQIPRMSRDEALARCREAREDVQELIAAATEAKWKVYIGCRELVLSRGSGASSWKIKLDTANKGGVNVRIEAPSKAHAGALSEAVTDLLPAKPTPRLGVTVFRLSTVKAKRLRELPGLIAQVRPHADAA